MGFPPTGQMVLAVSGTARASNVPGWSGDSSPSTTDAPVGPTTEHRRTSSGSTRPPVGSTETGAPVPTETTTEPPTATADRTTYPSGVDRLTVIGVDGPEPARHLGSGGDPAPNTESTLEKGGPT